MTEIKTQMFSVTAESSYRQPVLFEESRWGEIAKAALNTFASNGLRADQITVRRGDEAFNYEISFSLFNRNGTFRIWPERLEVAFQNAVSAADEEVIVDTVVKFYERLPLPEIRSTKLLVYVHANLESIEARSKFLAAFGRAERQIVSGGVIAYVISEKWKEEFRVTIDRSFVHAAGIFLSWESQIIGSPLTREKLVMFAEACEDVTRRFDLVFKKT